jgi:hypothetical protein|tara:strand:- start:30 stop:2912 length:2883 start_codon:yes stop_codon:yes gene_type:complete
MGCITKEQKEEIQEKVVSLRKDWKTNPVIRRIVRDKDYSAFKKMFRAATGEDYDFGDLPTMQSLKRFERRVVTFEKRLLKGAGGKVAQLFYLPEEFLKGNPAAAKTFDDLVENHNYYRGEKESYLRNVIKMADHMGEIAQSIGIVGNWDKIRSVIAHPITRRGGAVTIARGRKALQEVNNEYQKIKVEDGVRAAHKFWTEAGMDKLAKKEQFIVFEKADKVLRNPELINTAEYAEYAPIHKLWVDMRPKLFNTLKSGIQKYIKLLDGLNNKDLDNVIKSLEKLDDTLKIEKDYFPTQLLNIFPTMKRIQDTLYTNKDIKALDIEDLDLYVNNMVNDVARKIPVADSAREKTTAPGETRYNKNIIGVLDTYISDVTKFNYMVDTTSSLLRGTKKLRGQSDAEIDGSTKVYIDYLFDTHATMLGYNVKSPAFRSLVRGLTSWQFISKLGFNLRSAARNSTQSLQNLVHFGVKGSIDAIRYLRDSKMQDAVIREMDRHGIFFEEVRELSNLEQMFPDVEVSKIDGQEVLTWKVDSSSEKWLKGMDRVAKASGKPMRVIENNLNRNLTFKIAFAKMHSELFRNKGDVRSFIEAQGGIDKGGMTETAYGKELSKEVDQHMIRKSGRFAANMVRLLHYEYSAFAKPKIMRTGAGAVMGQFMTYSVNFFNYNYKMARDAKSDVLAGDWKSDNVRRVSTMGMTYFFINGLLGTLFNTDFSNLVQHDVYERAQNIVDWAVGTATDDKELLKRAFYGKGPIVGTIGGPFISDMITMGGVFGLWDLLGGAEEGDREFLGYLAGYQDYSDKTGDDKVFEVARTLSSTVTRWFSTLLPRAHNGAGFGTIAAMEMGLYPSAKIKERKAKVIKAAQKVPGLGWIPTPAYAVPKKPKRKKKPTEKDRIIQALGALGKVSSGNVGSNQWLTGLIRNQKTYGASLQPLKGNMSKYNDRFIAAAKREGYVGDFDQGTWT